MKQKTVFAILLIFNFFQTLNVSVLPYFILDISQDPNVYGLSISLYSFGMFFGSIILGALSDKFNRKYVVIIFIPLYAVLQIFLPIIHSVFVLYLLRFFSGVFLSGVVSNTFPLILENVGDSDKKITDYTNYSTVLITLGTVVGGIMASYISYSSPIILQLFLSLILSVILYFTIDDVKEISKTKKVNLKITCRQKLIFGINAIYILIFFYLLQFGRYILLTVMEITPDINGYVSAYTGILGLIIGSIIYPKIKNKKDEYSIMKLGLNLLLLGVITLNLSISTVSIVVFLTFCIAPQNLMKIPLNKLLSENLEENKGYIFGVNNAIISFFSTLGSMLVGPGINYMGINSLVIVLLVAVSLYPLIAFPKQVK